MCLAGCLELRLDSGPYPPDSEKVAQLTLVDELEHSEGGGVPGDSGDAPREDRCDDELPF